MDLQNVSAILKDLVAQSIVFSAHLRKFSPLIHRTTKRTFPVTMKKVSFPRIATEDNVDGFLKTERISLQIEEHRSFKSSPNHSKSE